MIATWLFVGFFVLLGIGVVVAAMSGTRGRRPAQPDAAERARLRSRDRAQTRAIALGIAVTVAVTGIAIPAVVLVANAADAPKRARGGVDLTAAQVEGRELFYRGCGQCHTLAAANTVGRVGPDLDQMRPPKALVLDAIEKGRARGMGQMPANVFDGEEAEHVAEFVEAVAGR